RYAPPDPSAPPLHDALPIWCCGRSRRCAHAVSSRDSDVANTTSSSRCSASTSGGWTRAQPVSFLADGDAGTEEGRTRPLLPGAQDRKSTRLNSSHEWISYAV